MAGSAQGRSQKLNSYLDKYGLDLETGFLTRDPLSILPPHFEPWNTLALDVCRLVEERKLRDAVHDLSELDQTLLTEERQLRLAHLQLSLITSGYVWQEGDAGLPKHLPRNVAVPFHAISERLGLLPVISHATAVMTNLTLADPDGPWDPDNMRCLYHVPKTQESDWLIIITGHVEVLFAKCIEPLFEVREELLRVHQLGAQGSTAETISHAAHSISRSLDIINSVTKQIQETYARTHERLTPNCFFNSVRPFLAGWGGEKSPLPNGLVYEGVSNKPFKCRGGSGAQSVCIQMLDTLLGVEFTQEKRKFMLEMRSCMLARHRAAIEDLENWPLNLRDFVTESKSLQLHDSYNRCVESLVNLRSCHIQVVAKYVVVPASKENRGRYASLDKIGTGGTSILPFLKRIRDDTKEFLLPMVGKQNRTCASIATNNNIFALILATAALSTLALAVFVTSLQH